MLHTIHDSELIRCHTLDRAGIMFLMKPLTAPSDRIRTRPGLRLATGHPTISLASSPTSRPLDGAIVSQMSESAVLAAQRYPLVCVASHVTAWQSVSAPKWVIRTITTGYRLQFARKPPHFNGVISSHTEEKSAHILKDEISGGGLRGAPALEQTAVLLPVFSGPQERRCSLSYLGSKSVEQTFEEMRKYNFRMLIHSFLLRSIKENNWFTSVDLKDAFFHKHLSSAQKIP